MFNKSTNINKTYNHNSNRWTCVKHVIAQKWGRDKPVYWILNFYTLEVLVWHEIIRATKSIQYQSHVKSSMQKLYCHHHGLIVRYEIFKSQLTMGPLCFTYFLIFCLFCFLYHQQHCLFDMTMYMSRLAGVL